MQVLGVGRFEGDSFYLPAQLLDRRLYEAVNLVLTNAGGNWNRSKKAHVFPNGVEKLREAIASGNTINEKKIYQFFETPRAVADMLITEARLEHGLSVLEPSAGHGALLDPLSSDLQLQITAVEVDPAKCDVLKQKGYKTANADFMAYQPGNSFDRVIMNPPFTKQQDIEHVMQAWEFLKPEGRLVSVMSPSFEFRTNKKSVAFKEFLTENGYWFELPRESFKESGTNIRTVIVVLNK